MTSQSTWRTPLVVLTCGTLILLVTFGSRQVSGLFVAPMGDSPGWSRDALSLAIAVQALVWGICTPMSGAVADRFGAGRVVATGTVLYVVGLLMLSRASGVFDAVISLGILSGVGMSTAGFSVILAVIGRAVPDERRSFYLGIASAGGSSGQFVMVPATQYLIDAEGWSVALVYLAILVALVIPLAIALAGPNRAEARSGHKQSFLEVLDEARSHGGFVLLVTGYFVCGFQVSFISAHLPGYLTDAGTSGALAAWSLSLVGLFNIVGCFIWGRLGDLYTKKYLLCLIYLLRAAGMAVFVVLPITDWGVLAFGAFMGLLWLATVPLTSGMVAQIFGVQYMGTLVGLTFLSHQLGSALGVWLGGRLYAMTGEYDLIWWVAIGLGVAAAAINWPIDDRPVTRVAAGRA